MELEVYWTDFSKKELKNIFDYYKENASLQKSLQNLKSNQKLDQKKNY
jgi:hypothetical protein